jgi:hypothetical protein
LFPTEGNRWIVSVGGAHVDKPPASLDELLAFLRGLRTPTIYNAIKNAKPVGEIARYGLAASEWRHFERLEHLPCGLLPVADAICRYNPVYGQGMSVAALEARILRQLLGTPDVQCKGLAALAPAFSAEAEPLIDTAWQAAAVPDLVLSETTGQRPADFEDRLRFRLALTRLAVKEPVTHRLMVEVQHLLKLQSVFRDPELLRRVRAVMAEMRDAKGRIGPDTCFSSSNVGFAAATAGESGMASSSNGRSADPPAGGEGTADVEPADA